MNAISLPCARAGLAIVLAALFLAALQTSFAQSTWTGNSSAMWSVAGNWDPSGAPGLNADVIVDRYSATVYTISLDASPTLNSSSSNITGNSTTITPSAAGNRTLNITATFSDASWRLMGRSGPFTYNFIRQLAT